MERVLDRMFGQQQIGVCMAFFENIKTQILLQLIQHLNQVIHPSLNNMDGVQE